MFCHGAELVPDANLALSLTPPFVTIVCFPVRSVRPILQKALICCHPALKKCLNILHAVDASKTPGVTSRRRFCVFCVFCAPTQLNCAYSISGESIIVFCLLLLMVLYMADIVAGAPLH